MKKLIFSIVAIASFLGVIVYLSCSIAHTSGYVAGLKESSSKLQPVIKKQNNVINRQDTLINRQSKLINDLADKLNVTHDNSTPHR